MPDADGLRQRAEQFLKQRADPAKCHADVRAYTYAETLDVMQEFAEAQLQGLQTRIAALVESWRAEAESTAAKAGKAIYEVDKAGLRGEAYGLETCADELATLIQPGRNTNGEAT